ncbi:MAG: ATP-binding protein [Lachnospiraceae bacterium]|nr:ATP-binding protein [Lachnospiraceae bacterium]
MNINVELISGIMKYLKNKDQVVVTTGAESKTGVIDYFDGNTIKLDTGDIIECEDITDIHKKPVINASDYIGKRVILTLADGSAKDGVVCGGDEESVSFITENGMESVNAYEISEIREFEDISAPAGEEVPEETKAPEVPEIPETPEAPEASVVPDLADAASENETEELFATAEPGTENETGSVQEMEFKSVLVEGSYYLFDEELSGITALSDDEKKACLDHFNEQEYDAAGNILAQKKDEDKRIQGLLDYLAGTKDRYEAEKNSLIRDGSAFFRGIVASKVELNPDKGYRYFIRSIEETPEKAKNAIYRIVVLYLSTENYDRCLEIMDYLLSLLKKVTPEYGQVTSLKMMLLVYQNAGDWSGFLDLLGYTISVSESHPVACINNVLKCTRAAEEHVRDDRIIEYYKKAILLGNNRYESVLRLANYILGQGGDATDTGKVEEALSGLKVDEIWSDIKARYLNGMLGSEDRYAYIEKVAGQNPDLDESLTPQPETLKITRIQKSEDALPESAPESGEGDRAKLENDFLRYLKANDAFGAKSRFSALLKKHDSDPLYIEMNLRAELFAAQLSSFNKGKKTFPERYGKAMSKWLADHEPLEAERLFMDDIMADTSSKGMSILSCLDMMVVEFGLKEALNTLLDLQQEIKLCDRNEKVAFYEKKYTFASIIDDFPNALGALETLRTIYYNKMKLGNCWYRSGECYRRQSKWKQARNCFEKSMEYGYMENICRHQINLCMRNLGENVEGDAPASAQSVTSVNLDDINARLDAYYNALRYKEAYSYINELSEMFPDNSELARLADNANVILQRYVDYGTSMPKGTDNHAIALRAWHIEENVQKAKKYYESEITGKGEKYVSCIMDLSELLLHSDGLDAAIGNMEKYEGEFEKLPITKQTGYYEKLNLMYVKAKDTDNIIRVQDKLIELYGKTNKKDKVTFCYFRSAIACYQDKRYEQTVDRMQRALQGGYKSNVCYQCVALSYAYLGRYDEAFSFIQKISSGNQGIDSELQNVLKDIDEQIGKIRESGSVAEEDDVQNNADFESIGSDLLLGYAGRFEAFFVERYAKKPVGIPLEKIEQNLYRDYDVSRLDREAWEHKLRERTGFFGTAAYLENQINGNSTRYYELLRNSASSWGLELQKNGSFNCACACFEFSMENDVHMGRVGRQDVVNYLSCVARIPIYNMPDNEEGIKNAIIALMSQAMDGNDVYGDSYMKEIILLISKSKYLRDVLASSDNDKSDIWISQLANFISASGIIKTYDGLFEAISRRSFQDENDLLDLISKVKTVKAFNDDQLNELRAFKGNILAFDADIKYLDSLVNAYEKGIEIYDYDDYDNRMATIGNVHNQLEQLLSTIDAYPTYFGIRFLSEIAEDLLDILDELSRRTRDELRPDLTVQIPITDVPIVDEIQGISVTVINKENTASARDVRLKVEDIDGNELVEEMPIAQYLKGGRSASKELEIPSQGETYTVKLITTYIDHEDVRKTEESLFAISSAKDVFEPIQSPYFTGDSIDVTQAGIFVGRDVLLDTLENALVNNVSGCEIIYGQKRCGKSSIANFLEDRLKDRFMIIKFSIGAAKSATGVYNNIRDLIVDYAENLLEDSKAEGLISEEFLDELSDRKFTDDEEFVSFMRLVHRKICKPLGKEILIMIDEFTHLYRYIRDERPMITAFMDTWKKLLEADLFKAVLIGQDTMPNFIKEFRNQFQVTQPIRVDRLDDESVRQLIEEPLRLPGGETRFMENSVDLIASWFYGQPYYIQLYCDRLVKQMNIDKRVRVTNALAEKVKALMLEEADVDLFDNLLSPGDESGVEDECYDILKRIAALTRNSEWADIDEIDIENKDVLIQDLIDRAVIKKKENTKVKILISFFREWMNMN